MAIRKCRLCENTFTPPFKAGRPPEFCSLACRVKHKADYHKSYDGSDEQKKRRIKYYHDTKGQAVVNG